MTPGNTTKLLFELSGEHQKLPLAELKSVLLAYKEAQVITLEAFNRRSERLIIIELSVPGQLNEFIQTVGNRLAMSRNISELIAHGKPDDVSAALIELTSDSIPTSSTFKLFTNRQENAEAHPKATISQLKDEIVQAISKFAKVNVTSPDTEIILYMATELYLVKKLYEIPRSAFETRKPQDRPYFAPVSLHPRLARCLVNLAGLVEGQTLLDPFCGTGGILLEAGLVGQTIIGSDSDPNMVSGTVQNLEHWNLTDHRILNSAIEALPERISELVPSPTLPAAIVTEPPYGRASTTHGEPLESLFERTFKVFAQVLQPGGKVVITLPDTSLVEHAKPDFELLQEFKFHVHKSLEKTIYVFRLRN